MFINTSITVYGTALDHLKAVKSFFINNTVAPFELVEENFENPTEEVPNFTVKRGKLYIYFNMIYTLNNTYNQQNKYLQYRIYDENKNIPISPYIRSVVVRADDVTTEQIAGRAINIFLNYADEILGVGLSSYDANALSALKKIVGTYAIFVTYPEKYDNIFITEMTGNNAATKYYKNLIDGSNISLCPLVHNFSDISKLLVTDKVELYNANLDMHISFPQHFISVGGAESGIVYKINGKNYLCIDNRICTPIGEMVEYIPVIEEAATAQESIATLSAVSLDENAEQTQIANEDSIDQTRADVVDSEEVTY